MATSLTMKPEFDRPTVTHDICDFLSKIAILDASDLNFITSATNRLLNKEESKSIFSEFLDKIKNRYHDYEDYEKSESRDELVDLNKVTLEKIKDEVITDASDSIDILENPSIAPVQSMSNLQDNTIQIKASKLEIDRRIESYMNRKQVEVNEFNRREFSFASGTSSDNWSCARTDSVFIPRAGSRSHIKITKVVNSFGPQTQLPCTNQDEIKTDSDIKQDFGISGLEERLKNIETHIIVPMDSKDICARIKAIEERILFLEGLSPEYFNHVPARKYKKRSQETKHIQDNCKRDSDLSLTEIDAKIQMLQETLFNKQKS